MSTRELRALGVTVNATVHAITMSAITANQVNPFHNNIDLSTEAGKKLHQQAVKGLPNEQKHDGNSKGIIKFMERVSSKAEKFGWKSIAESIGPENTNLFDAPGKLTIEVCKDHCETQWANSANLQFCVKSNIGHLFLQNIVTQNVVDVFPKEMNAH